MNKKIFGVVIILALALSLFASLNIAPVSAVTSVSQSTFNWYWCHDCEVTDELPCTHSYDTVTVYSNEYIDVNNGHYISIHWLDRLCENVPDQPMYHWFDYCGWVWFTTTNVYVANSGIQSKQANKALDFYSMIWPMEYDEPYYGDGFCQLIYDGRWWNAYYDVQFKVEWYQGTSPYNMQLVDTQYTETVYDDMSQNKDYGYCNKDCCANRFVGDIGWTNTYGTASVTNPTYLEGTSSDGNGVQLYAYGSGSVARICGITENDNIYESDATCGDLWIKYKAVGGYGNDRLYAYISQDNSNWYQVYGGQIAYKTAYTWINLGHTHAIDEYSYVLFASYSAGGTSNIYIDCFNSGNQGS